VIRLRNGTKQPRNIYEIQDDGTERLCGQFDREYLAIAVVRAVNLIDKSSSRATEILTGIIQSAPPVHKFLSDRAEHEKRLTEHLAEGESSEEGPST
jgi:hypothetical protein